jgi:hypothetical protein
VPPPIKKTPLPPEDVIREDSGPTVTDVPKRKSDAVSVDVDDAMIEEPKDDVFKKDARAPKQNENVAE